MFGLISNPLQLQMRSSLMNSMRRMHRIQREMNSFLMDQMIPYSSFTDIFDPFDITSSYIPSLEILRQMIEQEYRFPHYLYSRSFKDMNGARKEVNIKKINDKWVKTEKSYDKDGNPIITESHHNIKDDEVSQFLKEFQEKADQPFKDIPRLFDSIFSPTHLKEDASNQYEKADKEIQKNGDNLKLNDTDGTSSADENQSKVTKPLNESEKIIHDNKEDSDQASKTLEPNSHPKNQQTPTKAPINHKKPKEVKAE